MPIAISKKVYYSSQKRVQANVSARDCDALRSFSSLSHAKNKEKERTKEEQRLPS
jgi:hypothetical protein